jgi:hypothetical protein
MASLRFVCFALLAPFFAAFIFAWMASFHTMRPMRLVPTEVVVITSYFIGLLPALLAAFADHLLRRVYGFWTSLAAGGVLALTAPLVYSFTTKGTKGTAIYVAIGLAAGISGFMCSKLSRGVDRLYLD